MTVGLIFVGHIIVGFMFARLVTIGLKKEKKKDKNIREKNPKIIQCKRKNYT
jgi:uncharacterized membrane-anchored protein YhcB (DUF1043 family)